jgi:hypothetical protein
VRPTSQPAQRIYDAFEAEARNRNACAGLEWIVNERNAVHAAARSAASDFGLRCPTIEDVIAAENYATGSADYGAKWAYALADRMQRSTVKDS